MFLVIVCHKQPQNVDLKQMALLKCIYYDNLEKTFTVYQCNACKSIIDDRGRAGFGEKELCQKKKKHPLQHKTCASRFSAQVKTRLPKVIKNKIVLS